MTTLTAHAQQSPQAAWPERPISVLVGFPPGQGSDLAARYYGEQIQKKLSVPLVVENKPGAGATLAVAAAVSAPSDGHTILFSSSGPLSIAPHLYGNLGFDATQDLEPVAVVGFSPLMLVVRPDHPATSVADLIEMAKKKEITGGSGGNGVTNHLALEMFKIATGAKIQHVPYRGAAPAMADLIGGHIDMMFETTSAALAHVQAGRLKALAVTSPQRYHALPDVIALSEIYPGYEAMTWAMVATPKKTPAPIVERLSALFNEVMSDPEAQQKLRAMGIDTEPGSTPEQAKAYLIAEYNKWGDVIRKANVKLE